MHSTDGGRTWSAVDLRIGPDEVLWVDSVDGLLVARTPRRAWASRDGGGSWRPLGAAPVIPDDEGLKPNPEDSAGVRVVEASGDRLLAVARVEFNPDHYLPHFAWSEDEGASWHPAEMGVRCTGAESTSQLWGPVRVASVLVATWNCLGDGDWGAHVLVSTDEGRTWRDQTPPTLEVRDFGEPVVLGADQVVALGAENMEQSMDAVIEVTVAD